MKMNLTGAIEILKLHKHTTDKFKHSVGDQYVSDAIDTVIAEVEKPLPTDEEIVKEANEIGEKESWPVGRQTGFIFGAKWIRNLIRKEATE